MESSEGTSTASDLTEENQKILSKYWSPFAIIYDPLKAGSIDGTDKEPHDKAIVRAQNAEYRPNSKVKGKPECTIFVSRFDLNTKESTLREHFSNYGRIVHCRLVEDIVTGRSKGYAFIEYETERAAARAYRKAYKMRLEGQSQKLLVDMECERLLPGWVPRRLGGGFDGRKESGQLRFGGRDRPFKKPIGLLSSDEILWRFDDKFENSKPDFLKNQSS